MSFLAAIGEIGVRHPPVFTAWLFYTANVVLLSAYLVGAAVIVRQWKELIDRMGKVAWISLLLFFTLSGFTHLELALHAYFNQHILRDNGGVSLALLAIHVPQAVAIVTFLVVRLRADKREREAVAIIRGNPPEK